MSEDVKQLFTDISSTYDKLNHVLSFNIDKLWRKDAMRRIQFKKNEPISALDVCAGTLDLSLTFLQEYQNGHVTSLDFSQAMLDYGMGKIKPHQKQKIKVVCGDALNLPFDDGHFDVVFSAYGFRNLDHQDKGLREMFRVLKPGGQLLILEFFRPENIFSKTFHATYGKFLLPTIGQLISGNKEAYQYLHASIQKFLTQDQCKELMEKEGFKFSFLKNYFMGVSSLISGVKPQA